MDLKLSLFKVPFSSQNLDVVHEVFERFNDCATFFQLGFDQSDADTFCYDLCFVDVWEFLRFALFRVFRILIFCIDVHMGFVDTETSSDLIGRRSHMHSAGPWANTLF